MDPCRIEVDKYGDFAYQVLRTTESGNHFGDTNDGSEKNGRSGETGNNTSGIINLYVSDFELSIDVMSCQIALLVLAMFPDETVDREAESNSEFDSWRLFDSIKKVTQPIEAHYLCCEIFRTFDKISDKQDATYTLGLAIDCKDTQDLAFRWIKQFISINPRYKWLQRVVVYPVSGYAIQIPYWVYAVDGGKYSYTNYSSCTEDKHNNQEENNPQLDSEEFVHEFIIINSKNYPHFKYPYQSEYNRIKQKSRDLENASQSSMRRFSPEPEKATADNDGGVMFTANSYEHKYHVLQALQTVCFPDLNFDENMFDNLSSNWSKDLPYSSATSLESKNGIEKRDIDGNLQDNTKSHGAYGYENHELNFVKEHLNTSFNVLKEFEGKSIDSKRRYSYGALLGLIYLVLQMEKSNEDTEIHRGVRELIRYLDPSKKDIKSFHSKSLVLASRAKDVLSETRAREVIARYNDDEINEILIAKLKKGLSSAESLFESLNSLESEVKKHLEKEHIRTRDAIVAYHTDAFSNVMDSYRSTSRFKLDASLTLKFEKKVSNIQRDSQIESSVSIVLREFYEKNCREDLLGCIDELNSIESSWIVHLEKKSKLSEKISSDKDKLNSQREVESTLEINLQGKLRSINQAETELSESSKYLDYLMNAVGPIDPKWLAVQLKETRDKLKTINRDLKKYVENREALTVQIEEQKAAIALLESGLQKSKANLQSLKKIISECHGQCNSIIQRIEALYLDQFNEIHKGYSAADLYIKPQNHQDIDWNKSISHIKCPDLSTLHYEFLKVEITDCVKKFIVKAESYKDSLLSYYQARNIAYTRLRDIHNYFRKQYRAGDLIQIDVLCNDILSEQVTDLEKIIKFECSGDAGKLKSFKFDVVDASKWKSFDEKSKSHHQKIENLLTKSESSDSVETLFDIYLRIITICTQSANFSVDILPYSLVPELGSADGSQSDKSSSSSGIENLQKLEDFLILLLIHMNNGVKEDSGVTPVVNKPLHGNSVLKKPVPQEIIEYLLHKTTYQKMSKRFNHLFSDVKWDEFSSTINLESSVMFKIHSRIRDASVTDIASYYLDSPANMQVQETGKRSKSIFICYATSDGTHMMKSIVSELSSWQSTDTAVNVFVDADIGESDPWLPAITQMIRLCDIALVLITESSMTQHLFGKVFIKNLESRQIELRMLENESDAPEKKGFKVVFIDATDKLNTEDPLLAEVYGNELVNNIRENTFFRKGSVVKNGKVGRILSNKDIRKILAD